MGLLGPSLNELASQEIKKKSNKNHNNTEVKKEKKEMTLYQRYMYAAFIIVGAIIIIIGGSILYTNITKPKADYTNFKIAMKSYLDNNEDISDIIIQDNNMFKVIVNDIWNVSTDKEKLKFCTSVHDSIYLYAHQYKLIYKDSDNVYVNFYDASNNKVAKQDLNSFEILQ
jgi:hypothetical protein